MSALEGLPDDFRDLLVALADASVEFVLRGREKANGAGADR